MGVSLLNEELHHVDDCDSPISFESCAWAVRLAQPDQRAHDAWAAESDIPRDKCFRAILAPVHMAADGLGSSSHAYSCCCLVLLMLRIISDPRIPATCVRFAHRSYQSAHVLKDCPELHPRVNFSCCKT